MLWDLQAAYNIDGQLILQELAHARIAALTLPGSNILGHARMSSTASSRPQIGWTAASVSWVYVFLSLGEAYETIVRDEM